MQTFEIPAGLLDPESVRVCIEALHKGEIICYPTETFYALGIDMWNDDAYLKLLDLKGRSAEKELPLIASDLPMVASICETEDSRYAALASKFWPGPLTLVLPSLDGSRTYAIRVSSHAVARQIAQAFGSPVVSTSANISGNLSIRNLRLLPDALKQEIAVAVDGGTCPGGLPSTIVSLLERPGRILRKGAIPDSEIVSLL